ncbi:arginase family-domain-containing protein [Penicillium chrysogenum]|uniref:arginase family-domain-containing protein n=2 Tax=Penicillium chrysogenum species complex TaxID=254878 RepID=UPI0023A1D385|nr:arginase family-domain-containing protein [Penicillium chrysogenum]KAJ5249591.1 arginase family-domain-containing protein [Penicillium chrysogenum]KAJ5265101.1 arginase family-domain-containing protein [Penicillium chrysogenum]
MQSYRLLTLILLGATSFAFTGHYHEAEGWTKEDLAELEAKGGQNYAFSGISTFANLEHTRCLLNPRETFDIAVLGAPYDTSVGYRPGARFGPRAIRHVSGRQSSFRGFNPRAGINPYQSWAKIIDCRDIPVTPFDNDSSSQATWSSSNCIRKGEDLDPHVGSLPQQLVTLGGDHSLSLPTLRALKEVHNRPIQVLHFDAHMDTWHPEAYPSYWGTTHFTHGSIFWATRLCWSPLPGTGRKDNDEDTAQDWLRIPAEEIDNIGTRGIINQILDMLETEQLVYLSVDIDVLDPAFAPGTGTPEPRGWSS